MMRSMFAGDIWFKEPSIRMDVIEIILQMSILLDSRKTG